MWAFNTISEEILFIYPAEFNAATMTKGLPYQRGGFKDYIWINNGDNESLVNPTINIPAGWVTGRINGGSISHMKSMAEKRHTKLEISIDLLCVHSYIVLLWFVY